MFNSVQINALQPKVCLTYCQSGQSYTDWFTQYIKVCLQYIEQLCQI